MYRFLCLAFACILLHATHAQDHVYGLHFSTSQLRMAKANINTGDVDILTVAALSPDGFSQGVADFDPFNKRYFYIRGGRLYVVDALTGSLLNNPLIENPNAAVEAITNIAFNWMDNELYGVMHEYTNGMTQLSLVKVNIFTGALTIISPSPVINQGYLSGNTDIDPINRTYYLVTGNRLYVVDLDTGELIHEELIQMPFQSGSEYIANITYDWQSGLLYGLHFYTPTPVDPFGPMCQGQLRLVTLGHDGSINVLSQSPTSPDCFSMGDCDIDPVNNRYIYIRQNRLYTVSLTDGNLISDIPIENSNGAVAPIINMVYDDMAVAPAQNVVMDMGGTAEMQSGSTMQLDAWLGDEDVSYVWSTGETSSMIEIDSPGSYSVSIQKGELHIHGEIEVSLSSGITEWPNDLLVMPNPAQEVIFMQGDFSRFTRLELIDMTGKSVLSTTDVDARIEVSTLERGLYLMRLSDDKSVLSKRIVLD